MSIKTVMNQLGLVLGMISFIFVTPRLAGLGFLLRLEARLEALMALLRRSVTHVTRTSQLHLYGGQLTSPEIAELKDNVPVSDSVLVLINTALAFIVFVLFPAASDGGPLAKIYFYCLTWFWGLFLISTLVFFINQRYGSFIYIVVAWLVTIYVVGTYLNDLDFGLRYGIAFGLFLFLSVAPPLIIMVILGAILKVIDRVLTAMQSDDRDAVEGRWAAVGIMLFFMGSALQFVATF